MLRAVRACLRGGISGPELDTAGALALARAEGVPGEVAGVLISEAWAGVREGAAERKTEGE